MAIVTSAEQLAGPHIAEYEGCWNLINQQGTGAVSAPDAASVLKKSGLSDLILSKIWELSDSGAKGYLDKKGFFCALKLVALVQNGQEANIGNLTMSCPPPNMGPSTRSRSASGAWKILPSDKSKFDATFSSLQPTSGLLPGDKVRPVLMKSGLPVDVLSQIWELADHNKDGSLDDEEFALAMHLVYQALQKHPLPTILPADLIPPRQAIAPPPSVRQLNTGSSVSSDLGSSLPVGAVPTGLLAATVNTARQADDNSSKLELEELSWVVSSQKKAAWDMKFVHQYDTDCDGLVSGNDIRDLFIQSGLPQPTLAHIWGLCDTHSIGSLNKEQFALANYLIEEKLMKGIEPPQQLTPEMVPPSMRFQSDQMYHPYWLPEVSGYALYSVPIMTVSDNRNNIRSVPTESSKELLQIESEIEEIKRKKIMMEGDKQQKEADLKIKSGEVQTLQKEYEGITSTIQQLERQKGEAQKKLDEMEDQNNRLDADVNELRDKSQVKQSEINSISMKMSQHELNEKEQEKELARLKQEFYELQAEEKRLEQELIDSNLAADRLKMTNQQSATNTDQANKYISELTAMNDRLQQLIVRFSKLINGGEDVQEPTNSEIASAMEPLAAPSSKPHVNGFQTAFGTITSDTNTASGSDPFGLAFKSDPFGSDSFGFRDDPFKDKGGLSSDPFAASSSNDNASKVAPNVPFGKSDPFATQDPFSGSDPFHKSDPFKNADPFAAADPFKADNSDLGGDTWSANSSTARPKSTDPLASDDLFASSSIQPTRSASAVPPSTLDSFDPFAPSKGFGSKTDDTFGFDAFGSSASPATKKKQPPPRPALPRPKATTPPPNNNKAPFNPDPFGMSKPSSGKPRPKAATPVSNDTFSSAFSSDPFTSNDPFSSGAAPSNPSKEDPFKANFSDAFQTDIADKDLAWAAQDSAALEAERKRQLAEQEKRDFEFALALSRANT